MTRPEPHFCPNCPGEVCALSLDLETGGFAKLPDRLISLHPMQCTMRCAKCDYTRSGRAYDIDVNLSTGRLEFGRLELDD